jgi:hypothetical protein
MCRAEFWWHFMCINLMPRINREMSAMALEDWLLGQSSPFAAVKLYVW